jgi:putative SOS response-associated peptidase YedK
MCGRFALATEPARVARFFHATMEAALVSAGRPPSWNVAPTDEVLGLRAESGDGTAPERQLGLYRWGLVPWWAEDPSTGNRLFNARAEAVFRTRAFREAAAERRLVVPADGFYEWHAEGGRRQPHYFTRGDGAPLAFAGVWETWRERGGAERHIRSCTVITTGAGPDMDGIHDRMPVVLGPDELSRWIDPEGPDPEELEFLLRPAPAGTLVHHRVDPRVGNVRQNDAALVNPVTGPPPGTTPSLFGDEAD